MNTDATNALNDRSTSLLNAKTEREFLPDILKAIAIFLMVWGHSIQYFHGSAYDFQNDFIFKLIYGFHMPLFAFISGYFFAYTVNRYKSLEVMKKKAVSLLLPCLTWGVILGAMNIAKDIVISNAEISASLIFNNIFEQIIDDYWFLKATFINCIFVMLVEKLFKGNTLVLLICPIVIFFLFRSTTVLSVMIYFALGYFISKRKKGIHIPKYIGWICMSIYVILIIMGMKGSLSAGFAGIFGVIGVVDLFVGFTKNTASPL